MKPVRRNRNRVIIDVLATRKALEAGRLSAPDYRTVERFLPELISHFEHGEAIKAHLLYPGDEDHAT